MSHVLRIYFSALSVPFKSRTPLKAVRLLSFPIRQRPVLLPKNYIFARWKSTHFSSFSAFFTRLYEWMQLIGPHKWEDMSKTSGSPPMPTPSLQCDQPEPQHQWEALWKASGKIRIKKNFLKKLIYVSAHASTLQHTTFSSYISVFWEYIY